MCDCLELLSYFMQANFCVLGKDNTACTLNLESFNKNGNFMHFLFENGHVIKTNPKQETIVILRLF